MQTNDDGWVALKRLRQSPKYVAVNGREYVFSIQHNVNLCWVHPNDVEAIFAVLHHCCGNSRKQQFFYATEDDVRIFLEGGR